MTTITVRHSLISNGSINDLLKSYEVGKIMKSSFLTRGLNDTYVIHTDKNQYIFRIYRKGWRDKSDVLFELDAINHLSKIGCSVSTPIKRKDGKWITEIHAPEGIRYGVLFTFTNGDRPEINKDNCFLIGKTLGTIHKATDSSPFHSDYKRSFDLNLDHLLEEPLAFITPTLQKFMDNSHENLMNNIISSIKLDLTENDLDYGFCHGDFHNFNMHIVGQHLEAFDFDCCSMGFRSYDIAVFWWNLKQNYPQVENQCWDEFLNGYNSQKTVSTMNHKVLHKFVTLRRIWFLGILLKNDDVWGTNWINKQNIQNFLSQIEKDAEKY